MKLFFDTEFTQLRKDTTLISIGLISEDNKKFYGILNDYDKSLCNEWIQTNVIDTMQINQDDYKNLTIKTGNRSEISRELKTWLNSFGDDKIQFISDVSHYDFVLLIDLLSDGKSAFDISENISPYCHDVNQDIANYLNISDLEAFDMNREYFIINHEKDLPKGDKHNSLYDALVIKQIYEIIERVNNEVSEICDFI